MRRLVALARRGDVGLDTSDDPRAFKEAVQWFRSRIPMTEAEYQELSEEIQERAFKVSAVAQADLVTQVYDALDSAIADGTTFEEFKEKVGAALEESWGGEMPGRLETIFRTNVQSAYGAGRYAQQTDPVVMHRRPVWQFSAIEDDRTSDICGDLDGTTLDADDPFWDTHQPPLHFNCRSTVIALTQEEGDEEGIDSHAPEVAPDDGFGDKPDVPAGDWEPDLKDYPHSIGEVLREKLGSED